VRRLAAALRIQPFRSNLCLATLQAPHTQLLPCYL
jgi:hypothetical protein